MAAFQATIKRSYIRVPQFTGTGLDDMTSSGLYIGTAGAVFTIVIDSVGGTDTFKWQKDGGAFTAGVNCAITATALSDGVSVTFVAITGHTIDEYWTVEAIAPQINPILSELGTVLTVIDYSNYLTNTDANHGLSDFDAYRRLYITPLGGTEIDVNETTAIDPPATATTNRMSYDAIAEDNVYELRFVTVPTWSAGTYTQDMCVLLTDVFYRVNTASTTQTPSSSATEWDVVLEAGLSSIYVEETNIALTYRLEQLTDEQIFEFDCTLLSACAETFCKNEASVKLFKAFVTLYAAQTGVQLATWSKVQTFLIEGNKIFDSC